MSRPALILLVAAVSSARAASLEDVLARMDSAAKKLMSYSVIVKRVDHYKYSIEETDGAMRFKRSGGGISGIMDFTAGPDYVVTFGGAEAVNETPATRIVLTPKSAEALTIVKTIELWIPDGEGYAIQQQGTKLSKETFLATFSDLRVNPSLPDSAFQLNVPRSVKRINMN